MGAVLRREFFPPSLNPPIGYVFLAAYYLICRGFLFYVTVTATPRKPALYFIICFMLLVFCCPILTMKLFSEKKAKTDQLLLTSPVTLTSLVYGKFFATFFIYGIGVGITLVFSLILAAFNSVDWMVVIETSSDCFSSAPPLLQSVF